MAEETQLDDPPIRKRLLVGLVVGNLLLIAVCTLGLFRVYHLSRTERVTYVAPKIETDTALTASPTPTPDASGVRKYSSSKLGISFSYPVNWDVSERADDISITSPDVTFTRLGPSGDTLSKGNLIVSVGKIANQNAFGKQALVDSIQAPTPLPGSSFSKRYLLVAGEKIGGKVYFDSLADTGHKFYKSGQSLGDSWDALSVLLPKVYGKYSIEAGYIHKDPGCQGLPCRDSVPWDEIKGTDVFAQGTEIMKSVSFPL